MADERVPELVRDLEDQITHYLLQETSIDRSRAILISKKVARHITANWGGQLLYIPKNHGGQLSERDMQIWSEFNGRNHNDLVKRYDLTLQQIYRILKDIGELERAKTQGDLFG